MLQIWISNKDVTFPEHVIPNETFEIKWNVWFLFFPFQKVNYFIRLYNSKNELLFEERTCLDTFWYWKMIRYKAVLSIPETVETFRIEVGHIT